MTKITLKKLGENKYGDHEWTVNGRPEFLITRRTWVLPHASTSYIVTENGKRVVGDFDRLADVRDYIEMENEAL